MAVITLTSDFGTQDHYVACMKGVILQTAPKATIVDITHDIAPHGIVQAAFVLRQIWPWFPPNTIHVAVVDPGVGTNRQILMARYSDQLVIAPDNGIVSLIHRDAQLQELRTVANRKFFSSTLSPTFHGRDVMAPVAAHIANGVRLSDIGPMTNHLEILKLPNPNRTDGMRLVGQVLYVDHFGNLITNVTVGDINALSARRGRVEVLVDDRSVGHIRATYGEVGAGQPLALVGSSQMLEIAINQGNAATALHATVGTPVTLY
ncbi:MAG: SAM-dependent chlorinase/fluorinase [Phycisphaerae bacterium]|nr:SAM-dependent chlorinase/fluorinase [Phycisphaerae bacterium]